MQVQDEFSRAIDPILEIVASYLDVANKGLAKSAQMTADHSIFTCLYADAAQALIRLQETVDLVLQELEQVRDDLGEPNYVERR